MNPADFVFPGIRDNASALALGIDTGGTQTRWALATANEDIIASGTAAGLTALQLKTQQGKQEFAQVFSDLAAAARSHGNLQTVRVGITGFSDDMRAVILEMLTGILHMPEPCIRLGTDIEIAYLDSFKPGTGYLVYAGTGSIAAYIDEAGQFHRAGGRGYLLDDGGSGFWIAREAVRHIWRAEDECPGTSRESLLAKEIFKAIGGGDWDKSKDFMYHHSRGDIGKLALAVAACANTDEVAADILKRAGQELARLGMAMCKRFGNKPVVLSGRVLELHPFIAASCRTHLPSDISLRTSICQAHFSAARLAARQLTLLS
ncbi:ATPase [Undibacterium sp. FT147W]|uniref:ATPase n=1 Tax=Undibacterium rivi TaxID=2828729 RepID=A0ABS5H2S9_9BURK|nr:BadF/BadG/BcrA/BcrD ATPase family protein [Undibacterium rivi]MBR7792995.1 ATPase [Undibacterium rivi]